ncbi:hypothetical protein D3871_11380 [Noviherbaspirillum saxi]|uniref:Uncharacterized protein n=1 Tax=Noviherbaspirillum saxi TaxID=2320863 RepID=A0A3A3FSM1_9BURK|nr:hypothetical protein D3871_11380 [Noviherbaspirillum saxi]
MQKELDPILAGFANESRCLAGRNTCDDLRFVIDGFVGTVVPVVHLEADTAVSIQESIFRCMSHSTLDRCPMTVCDLRHIGNDFAAFEPRLTHQKVTKYRVGAIKWR